MEPLHTAHDPFETVTTGQSLGYADKAFFGPVIRDSILLVIVGANLLGTS